MTDTYARVRTIYGTTAEWLAPGNDLVIGAGEIACEKMTNGEVKAKVGDGTRPFSALNYIVGSVSTVVPPAVATAIAAAVTGAKATQPEVEGETEDSHYVTSLGLSWAGKQTGGVGAEDKIVRTRTDTGLIDVTFMPAVSSGGTPAQADQLVKTDANGKISNNLLGVTGLEFLGTADPNAAIPPSPPAPALTAGQMYIASVDTTAGAHTSWTGIGGAAVKASDVLVYDGAKWDVLAAETDLSVYLPLTGGTMLGDINVDLHSINKVETLQMMGGLEIAVHDDLRGYIVGDLVRKKIGNKWTLFVCKLKTSRAWNPADWEEVGSSFAANTDIDTGTDTGKAINSAGLKHATDKLLPLAGGTVTGQIKGITPAAAADLTRKDYVDGKVGDMATQTWVRGLGYATQTWVNGKKYQTVAAANGAYLHITGGTLRGNLAVHGTITATSNITAYSDIRLKTNIRPIVNATDLIDKLTGYRYERKGQDDKEEIGVIAQEVEAILPELVETDEDGLKSVAYGNLTAVLINAVKELTERVKQLEQEK